MPSMFYAGAGAIFFGLAWIVGGLSMVFSLNGGPLMKLIGAGCFFWGVALMYLGRDLSLTLPPIDCSPIVVYSLEGCPWCIKAKELLDTHGRKYSVVEYTKGMENPPSMPNGQMPESFPQIWVGHQNMGGYSQIETWVHRCE